MNILLKRLIAIIVVSLSGVCVFSSSCNNEVINSYDYTQDGCYYYESYNDISKYYTINQTITDYASYNFDERISIAKRNRFVTFAEQLLEYLKPQELADKWLVFFISDDIKVPRAETEDYNIFCATSNTKTVELIGCVIQTLETNTLNYGLVYGLSAKIYNELNWGKISVLSSFKIKSFLNKEKNRFVLDLTYPIFTRKFASKEQIEYAKSISIMLVDYIEKTYGQQAFLELFEADKTFDLSFDHLFYGYLNEWLATINIANVTLNREVLKCIPYTFDFPFRMLTISCNYYMGKDWKESLLPAVYAYKDIQFNYITIKNILLSRESSYKEVRSFLEHPEIRQCPVLFQNGGNYSGITFNNYIVINSMLALTHEYAHFTCFSKYERRQSWMIEAVAYYCDAVFGDFNSTELYYAYHNRSDYGTTNNLTEYMLYIVDTYMSTSTNENYYLKFLEGYNYDKLFNEIDIHENLDEIKNSAFFTVSFSDYLIKTYGSEKYLELYVQFGMLEKAYAKSETEILDEYLDYLNNIFGS